MSFDRWKLHVLGLVIVMVDLATAANLYESYAWFERSAFAVLVAAAFGLLQVGTLVLFSMPLPETTRRLLFAGAAILLTVTGLSNVSMGYIRSKPVFPAEELLPALGFGGDAISLGVAAAWISGIALVATGLIFWTAFGQHVRQERDRQQQMLRNFDDLFDPAGKVR